MRKLLGLLTVFAPIVVVTALGEIHAHFIGHYSFTGTFRFVWTLTYIAIFVLTAYALGIPNASRTALGATWTAGVSVASAALIISLIQLLTGSLLLPRFVVFGAALVMVPTYVFIMLASRRVVRLGTGAERIFGVLDEDEERSLRTDLSQIQERPAQLVGVLTVNEATATSSSTASSTTGTTTQQEESTEQEESIPQEELSRQSLLDSAIQSGASVIVLGHKAQELDSIISQAAILHGRGIRIRTLTLFYDEWLGKLPVSDLERLSLMFDIPEIHAPRYARLKRLSDIVAGVLGVLTLLIAIPFVALLDATGNRGPIFFRQIRVGKGGAEFTIWKFRTMVPNTGAPVWTLEQDERLGSVGKWMRRVHLDELPQFINVLKGELSLVGPRPEQPYYVDRLSKEIPFYNVRHLVNPGITGWAQVKFGYGASAEDALEKLQYEFFYLRHQGPVLDTRIVARTIRQIVSSSGR